LMLAEPFGYILRLDDRRSRHRSHPSQLASLSVFTA
jgi:hypothetical protein